VHIITIVHHVIQSNRSVSACRMDFRIILENYYF